MTTTIVVVDDSQTKEYNLIDDTDNSPTILTTADGQIVQIGTADDLMKLALTESGVVQASVIEEAVEKLDAKQANKDEETEDEQKLDLDVESDPDTIPSDPVTAKKRLKLEKKIWNEEKIYNKKKEDFLWAIQEYKSEVDNVNNINMLEDAKLSRKRKLLKDTKQQVDQLDALLLQAKGHLLL